MKTKACFLSCLMSFLGFSSCNSSNWTDLTPDEFEMMKCHPEEGKKLLEYLPPIDGGRFNEIAMKMAYYHHEKWDGSGYPEGLMENYFKEKKNNDNTNKLSCL